MLGPIGLSVGSEETVSIGPVKFKGTPTTRISPATPDVYEHDRISDPSCDVALSAAIIDVKKHSDMFPRSFPKELAQTDAFTFLQS